MSLVRKPNWEKLLAQYATANMKTPFAWGTFDCSLFAAGAIETITGTDLATDWRGKYSDAAGAVAIYGANLQDFCSKIAAANAMKEIKPAFAQRGDVLLVLDATIRQGLAVKVDNRVFGAGPSGLVAIPRGSWLTGWKV